MDVKSLAKSKRAHSLHHNKKHQPNRTAKAPAAVPATAAGGEKQSGKQQVKEKPGHSRGPRGLPSNWDRYNEDGGSGSEDTSQESASKETDVVVPKSKGMDYAHLISEAKAQSKTASALQDPSFDADVDDLNQGIGPLLTVRGQSILSWIEDDNFELDNKATETDKYEAPFLSLDLNALAEELAKASLSERLFVEPDILPPEMCPELHADVIKLEQDEAKPRGEVAGTSSVSLQRNDVAEVVNNGLPQPQDVASSDATCSSISSGPDGGLKSTNHVNDDLQNFRESGGGSFLDTDSVANTRQPRFEAYVAEAELDVLLNSFTETKIEVASSPPASSSQPMNKDSGATKANFIAPNLDDDTLDELLKETSTAAIDTHGGSLSGEVQALPHNIPSTSNPVSKSKLLDDFGSWLDTI